MCWCLSIIELKIARWNNETRLYIYQIQLWYI